jgi:hypothetical protein
MGLHRLLQEELALAIDIALQEKTPILQLGFWKLKDMTLHNLSTTNSVMPHEY